MLSVNYAGFAPILVEGLKELEAKQQLETGRLKDMVMKQELEIERLKNLLLELAEPRRNGSWKFWEP